MISLVRESCTDISRCTSLPMQQCWLGRATRRSTPSLANTLFNFSYIIKFELKTLFTYNDFKDSLLYKSIEFDA